MTSADGALDPPPPSVAEAFGLGGRPHRLDGGQGVAFAVHDAVLKRADDGAEATLVQSLAARVEPTGYRLAEPIPTLDGAWVHEGWVANRLVGGIRPAAPDWPTILEAGEAFALDASANAVGIDRSALARRSHPWAVADRAAWGDGSVPLDAAASAVEVRLLSLTDPSTAMAPDGLVHADLAGNVHLDEDCAPVVLDLSLYERPAAWGSAVVVVDALLWHDASPSLVDAHGDRSGGIALLARAARFRLVADSLVVTGRLPDDVLDRYHQLATILAGR